MSQLYGKALANQVPGSVSGHQARTMFGAATAALAGAYETLGQYDSGFAEWSGLDAGSIGAARSYLDSTNAMLAGYFSDMPESSEPLSEHQLQELRTAVSSSSVAVKTIDDLFSTSWLSELCDAVIAAAGTVTASIANGVSKVAGSFVGGTWWLWLLVAGGLVFWSRYKRGKL